MTQTTVTTRDLARRSQAAAGAKDRETWLSLFTPDAVVADPIGPSPFDPDGTGHHGTTAIEAFYDNVIDQAERIDFEIEHSYLCGDEVADVGTIRTTLAGGTHVAVVHGVFTYRGNGNGQLTALRAYWQLDSVEIVEA
ncbi:MAG TPA: nuclear transport factor 2 family protein [Streptosporangiaceae bacterium]|nr:nuclear transport factor 2 family protein [Streptosporangiaceae bacterium]